MLGIRRIGKTSLLRSFLENWQGVYVDMRGVRTLADLYRRIGEGLASGITRLRRIVESIRGIRVMGAEVEIKWRGRGSISLVELLEELNKRSEKTIVVFDEVQAARPPVSMEVKNAVAYAYDNLENVMVVLSGSEVGLLRGFVGTEEPRSPLYGRYALELSVPRFPPSLSAEFLEKGFREYNINPDRRLIEEAVEVFDGIVGWLVYFGKSYVDGVRDFSRIVDMAVETAARELEKLSDREKLVLKAVAEGASTWSSVRRYVEEKEGITIPKSTLTRIIRRLEKMSIIRDYQFLDPVYRRAARRLRTRKPP